MAFTYNLSTDIGKMRLLIPDRSASAYFFEDAELTAMLSAEGDNVKRGTALALETMASNEAYVQKVIRLLDLSTNGPAVAASLMARAAQLREQADTEEGAAGGDFDWAEQTLTSFAERDIRYNEWLRDG